MLRVRVRLPEISKSVTAKLILSIAFTSGIRIGGLLLIAFFFMILFFDLIKNWKEKKVFLTLIKRYSIFGILLLLLVYVLIVVTWPFAHQDPLKVPFMALTKFSSIDLVTTQQLFDGKLISNHEVPWNYLPNWIGFTTPLVVLVGILFLVFKLFKIRKNGAIFLLLFFTVFPPLYAIYSKSTLYDDWRHFYFLAPLLAIIAAVGWQAFYKLIDRKFWKRLVLITTIFLISLPAIKMIKMYPIQHLYFNELIGGLEGAVGKYELETYSYSMRYAMEWLNDNARENSNNIPMRIACIINVQENAPPIIMLPITGLAL
jgi:hypothetical protein